MSGLPFCTGGVPLNVVPAALLLLLTTGAYETFKGFEPVFATRSSTVFSHDLFFNPDNKRIDTFGADQYQHVHTLSTM